MFISDSDDWKKANKVFPKGERVLISYASQTGSARDISEDLLKDNSESCDLVPFNELCLTDLEEYGQQIFVVSTFGQGEAPLKARDFYKTLCKSSIDLTDVKFSVLALGNRQYPYFCGFGKSLHQTLIKLGAIPRMPIVQVDKGDAAVVSHWRSKLNETFGLKLPEALSDWTIATVMGTEQSSDSETISLTLYIPGKEYEPLEKVLLKLSPEESEELAYEAAVKNAADSPFKTISIMNVEKENDSMASKNINDKDINSISKTSSCDVINKLINAQDGDKFLVKIPV